MELKTLKGLALQDILTEIHLFVHRGEHRVLLRMILERPNVPLALTECFLLSTVDFPPSIRIQLLIKLADIE